MSKIGVVETVAKQDLLHLAKWCLFCGICAVSFILIWLHWTRRSRREGLLSPLGASIRTAWLDKRSALVNRKDVPMHRNKSRSLTARITLANGRNFDGRKYSQDLIHWTLRLHITVLFHNFRKSMLPGKTCGELWPRLFFFLKSRVSFNRVISIIG